MRGRQRKKDRESTGHKNQEGQSEREIKMVKEKKDRKRKTVMGQKRRKRRELEGRG